VITEDELRDLLYRRQGPASPQLRPRRTLRAYRLLVPIALALLLATLTSPALGTKSPFRWIFFDQGGFTPFHGHRTLILNWNESVALFKGKMKVHATKVKIDNDHWQVWGTVTNVSPYVVQIRPSESWVIKFKETGDQVEYHTTSMGLAFYPKGTSGGVHPHARIYKPALPTKIAPGKSWTGTWSGIDDLPAELGIEVSFGYFVPIGAPVPDMDPHHLEPGRPPAGYYWETDHRFTLKR
jgi:hypothetical protein